MGLDGEAVIRIHASRVFQVVLRGERPQPRNDMPENLTLFMLNENEIGTQLQINEEMVALAMAVIIEDVQTEKDITLRVSDEFKPANMTLMAGLIFCAQGLNERNARETTEGEKAVMWLESNWVQMTSRALEEVPSQTNNPTV